MIIQESFAVEMAFRLPEVVLSFSKRSAKSDSKGSLSIIINIYGSLRSSGKNK